MTKPNFNGHLLRIDVDGTRTETHIADRTAKLEELQGGVGGHIEVVPHFDHMMINGRKRRVIALCNEEGKLEGLPRNPIAHKLWEIAVGRKITEDYLVGPIVIVYGTPEWLAEF